MPTALELPHTACGYGAWNQWFLAPQTPYNGEHPLKLLLTPDAFLPAQLEYARNFSPEQRLLLAIVKEALECLSRGENRRPASRRLYREAREWFLSLDTHSLMSFVNLCGHLGVEAHALQQEIAQQYSELPPIGEYWLRFDPQYEPVVMRCIRRYFRRSIVSMEGGEGKYTLAHGAVNKKKTRLLESGQTGVQLVSVTWLEQQHMAPLPMAFTAPDEVCRVA